VTWIVLYIIVDGKPLWKRSCDWLNRAEMGRSSAAPLR
jgi:hypothetical protein